MNNGTIMYTTIDELIDMLKEAKEKLGDYPVCIRGVSPITIGKRPYYYDGGYCAQAADGSQNFLRSKDYSQGSCRLRPGMPEACIDLMYYEPGHDEEDKVDGRSVKEIQPHEWEWLEIEEQKERQLFNGQLVKYQWAYKRDEKGNWLTRAYLDSGEEAYGPCMKDAKEALLKIYKEKHG